MYPYLLKRKLFLDGSFNLPDIVTTSQYRFLYYLSVWKIFSKNSFFLPSQGGVPLDCGCKGRYFQHTDQTLSKLFYKKFLTKIITHWFSARHHFKEILHFLTIWQIHVAKHQNSAYSKNRTNILDCLAGVPIGYKNTLFRFHLPMCRQGPVSQTKSTD